MRKYGPQLAENGGKGKEKYESYTFFFLKRKFKMKIFY